MEEDEEKSCNIANNNGDTLINEQRNYIKKENKEKSCFFFRKIDHVHYDTGIDSGYTFCL